MNSYSFSSRLAPLRRAGQWLAGRLHNNPPLAALLLHAGLLTALYSALYCFGFITKLPTNDTLRAWDVADLLTVKDIGYADPTRGYNAFFPLVPLIWRYAHLDLLQSALLSTSVAAIGIYILARAFAFSGRQTLLVASAPLLMFTLVPYTEGFFFFFGAILVSGLHRNRLALTLVGLLGCCLTRSAGTLFVPAYLFAELLAWGSTNSGRRLLLNWVTGLLAIAASIGAVMMLQLREGGDALAFYKVHDLWGHKFVVPTDFLYSSAGVPMFWLDALALLVSMVALVSCAVLGVRWLRQRLSGQPTTAPSKAVLFALGYTAGAGFFIVFYQGGDLVGLSRYLFATPFWGALLAWAWQAEWSTARVLSVLGVALVVVGGLAGLPGQLVNFAPGEALWFFGLLGLYLAYYWLVRPDRCRWYREIATGMYFLNLFMLCFILNLFLNGVWVN
ncbi:hypothetical protein ACVWYF_001609 [Hymenobacter sp. UYAg731]